MDIKKAEMKTKNNKTEEWVEKLFEILLESGHFSDGELSKGLQSLIRQLLAEERQKWEEEKVVVINGKMAKELYENSEFKFVVEAIKKAERQRIKDKIKSKNIYGVHFVDGQVEALLKLLEDGTFEGD